MKILQTADVVLYDALISDDILAYCSPQAKLHYVGKRCGQHSYTQIQINQLLLECAKDTQFNNIVRLKGGDPAIFARLQEEIDILRNNNINFEIVAGVTAASAAAASLNIPLTQRGVCKGIQLRTLANAEYSNRIETNYIPTSNNMDTIVFYMAKNQLPQIHKQLKHDNFHDDVSVYLIENISLPTQRTLRTTLAQLTSRDTISWISQNAPLLLIVSCVN
jgi:uroporphyrin-III C-methyltransferase